MPTSFGSVTVEAVPTVVVKVTPWRTFVDWNDGIVLTTAHLGLGSIRFPQRRLGFTHPVKHWRVSDDSSLKKQTYYTMFKSINWLGTVDYFRTIWRLPTDEMESATFATFAAGFERGQFPCQKLDTFLIFCNVTVHRTTLSTLQPIVYCLNKPLYCSIITF